MSRGPYIAATSTTPPSDAVTTRRVIADAIAAHASPERAAKNVATTRSARPNSPGLLPAMTSTGHAAAMPGTASQPMLRGSRSISAVHQVQHATALRDGFARRDPELASEGMLEHVTVVLMRRLRSGGHEAAHLRVVGRNKFHDRRTPETREPFGNAWQRDIPGERDVVNDREREQRVRGTALREGLPLRAGPSRRRRWQQEVVHEREDRAAVARTLGAVGAVNGRVVAVDRDDPTPEVGRDAAESARVGAQIPRHLRRQRREESAHELLFR